MGKYILNYSAANEQLQEIVKKFEAISRANFEEGVKKEFTLALKDTKHRQEEKKIVELADNDKVYCKSKGDIYPWIDTNNSVEVQYQSGDPFALVGITLKSVSLSEGMDKKNSWSYRCDGRKVINGESSLYGEAWKIGDLLKIAVNQKEGWIEFFLNKKSQGKI